MKTIYHHTTASFLLLLVVLFSTGSCLKDYSFERTASPSPVNDDPLPPPEMILPTCRQCLVQATEGIAKWSFKTGSFVLCGNLTRGIVSPERTGFTFFGPSLCSADSGLIITAYLPPGVKLDSDQQNINTNRCIFQYYEKGKPDILISKPTPGFLLVIDSYNHQTGIAAGRFNGLSYTAGNRVASITDGKFQVKLE
jgi:hypothetical protein